jgi:hypothetical protein
MGFLNLAYCINPLLQYPMEKLTVQLDLARAIADDLKQWSSDQGKEVLKIGQMIFIKSQITNVLEGPYVLGHDSDPEILAQYLEAEMIYVPVDNFESQIPIIKVHEMDQAS